LEFGKLPAPSPGILGHGRDLMVALRDHQSQLELVCAALQVAQDENQQEAAQLARLQTAVANKVHVLQGSMGMAGSICLALRVWQSAEELCDRLAIQDAKPWTAQLDAVTASVLSICQQVAEATKGVEALYKGPAGATLKAANKF
jgi:hypothetical protein